MFWDEGPQSSVPVSAHVASLNLPVPADIPVSCVSEPCHRSILREDNSRWHQRSGTVFTTEKHFDWKIAHLLNPCPASLWLQCTLIVTFVLWGINVGFLLISPPWFAMSGHAWWPPLSNVTCAVISFYPSSWRMSSCTGLICWPVCSIWTIHWVTAQ